MWLSSSYGEGEGVRVLTQLLQQPLLQPAQRPLGFLLLLLLLWREDLQRAHVQVLPEGQAQDVQVLPTVTKRTGQIHKH